MNECFRFRSKYIEIINHTNSKKYEEPLVLQKLDLKLVRFSKLSHPGVRLGVMGSWGYHPGVYMPLQVLF